MHRAPDRLALLRQARLIGDHAARIANESDRRRVADRLEKTLGLLAPGRSKEG